MVQHAPGETRPVQRLHLDTYRSIMEPATSPLNSSGFQHGGRAWDPFRPDILDLLRDSTHAEIRPIYYGSNHTFLVTLDGGPAGSSYAIYKPARGEHPLYDFADGSLYRREIGTYLVAALLGWPLVPPTVRTEGRFGSGSLQLFVESYGGGEIDAAELRRMVLLDVLVNNADRKGEHVLLGEDNRLWGIDHGLTFHAQPKLRTVLWHFAGEPIPVKDLDTLHALEGELRWPRQDEACALRDLLARVEWRALLGRVQRLVQTGHFPDPRYKSVPYRW